jgi:hypothetical protein
VRQSSAGRGYRRAEDVEAGTDRHENSTENGIFGVGIDEKDNGF